MDETGTGKILVVGAGVAAQGSEQAHGQRRQENAYQRDGLLHTARRPDEAPLGT